MKVGVLDDADEVLERLDILQVLLRLIELLLELLVELLLQFLQDPLLRVAQIDARRTSRAVDLVLVLILLQALIPYLELLLDFLDSHQNLVKILLDEPRRLLNPINLLQALRL